MTALLHHPMNCYNNGLCWWSQKARNCWSLMHFYDLTSASLWNITLIWAVNELTALVFSFSSFFVTSWDYIHTVHASWGSRLIQHICFYIEREQLKRLNISQCWTKLEQHEPKAFSEKVTKSRCRYWVSQWFIFLCFSYKRKNQTQWTSYSISYVKLQ